MAEDLLSASAPTFEERRDKAISNYFWANKLANFPSGAWVEEGDPPPWDWVATVSYYSAIHFLLYYLQQFNPNIRYYQQSRRISNVDEYMRELNCHTFHAAYRKIVNQNFRQINTAWDFFYNTADSARYNAQIVPVDFARRSLAYLEQVRKVFDKQPCKPSPLRPIFPGANQPQKNEAPTAPPPPVASSPATPAPVLGVQMQPTLLSRLYRSKFIQGY